MKQVAEAERPSNGGPGSSKVDRSEFDLPGFCFLLSMVFIGLKLGGAIQWSWVWVLSPLWLPFALLGPTIVGILLVFGVLWVIVKFIEWQHRRKSQRV